MGTSEWGVSAFEEAWATHYGSATFWAANSNAATTCLSAVHCYNQTSVSPVAFAPAGGTNIEATSFPFAVNNCNTAAATPEGRWPLSSMRFLWDVYDDHNDGDGDSYSAANGQFWNHFANLAFYPQGTSADQIDEPWNSTRTAVTERDGRGSQSYKNNFQTQFPQFNSNIHLLWVDNCSPN